MNNLNFKENSLIINTLTTVSFSKADAFEKQIKSRTPTYLQNLDLGFDFIGIRNFLSTK